MNPPIAGITIRFTFCVTVCKAVALSKCSRPTRSPMIARRVGVMNVITAPWPIPMIVTCHHANQDNAKPTPVTTASRAMMTAQACRIVRFDILSARAPA
jgi:hypothetical protein